MSSIRLASPFTDPPVFAAGRSAEPHAVPGAAVRSAPSRPPSGRVLAPGLWFFGGMGAGAAMALLIARALLK